MSYKIDKELCLFCGTCEEVCPAGAISGNEIGHYYIIAPDVCLACGTCEGECPVGAISEFEDDEEEDNDEE